MNTYCEKLQQQQKDREGAADYVVHQSGTSIEERPPTKIRTKSHAHTHTKKQTGAFHMRSIFYIEFYCYFIFFTFYCCSSFLYMYAGALPFAKTNEREKNMCNVYVWLSSNWCETFFPFQHLFPVNYEKFNKKNRKRGWRMLLKFDIWNGSCQSFVNMKIS